MTPTTRFFTLRRTLLVGACALLLGVSAACDLDDENTADVVDTNTTPTNPTTASIGFASDAFSQINTTVAPGATVTWTNNTTDTEMVIEITELNVDSGPVQPGQTFSYTFNTPGQYTILELNSGAGGRVFVE